ncbi:MAG: outer membrane protein W [Crocinitomix sp.]|jgi:outer membrane protein W
MKRLLTFVGATLIATMGFNNAAVAQVEQGNVIIDLYYGYPNFGKKLADGINTASSEVTVGGIGPAGLRVEYMLADNFGLGIDFIYNSTNLSFTADSLNIDGTINRSYDVKTSMQRIRVMLRANYHFVQTDVLDAYVGFGAGTNNRIWGIDTDFPDYDDTSIGATAIPVSARLALGTRFYFTDNIGMNVEIGLGGPLLSAGLSLKF